MEVLQVEIVTATDGTIFQRNLNGVLKRLSNVAALAIKGGPPNGYTAVVTYYQEEKEGDETK